VKLLVLAANYPYPNQPLSGIFNERCVAALRELCDQVEVLAPRPYVPLLLSRVMPHWQAYASIKGYEVRNGIPVFRPASPVVPRIGSAFWANQGAFLRCRRTARNMHRRTRFNAILSFDLAGAGGLAWRTGHDLGIPASGWATGSDVRFPAASSYGKAVKRTIEHLDIVYYQSHELLDKAASLLDISSRHMSSDRHIVLPRGIPTPPSLPRSVTRSRIRAALGMTQEEIFVLSSGRICQAKGIFELLEAVTLAAARNSRVSCVLVGSLPAFDETAAVQRKLEKTPGLKERVQLLPACSSEKVWEYLCAADIFAFTSHHEGMPNSLLEAMAMGLPAVAFAIPPVVELEAGTGALVTVPPFNSARFAEVIVRLAASLTERVRMGEKAKALIRERYMVKNNMAIALERLAQVKGDGQRRAGAAT
jgi:teichuronic acid biosynthesis glycosyltransferase TuaC